MSFELPELNPTKKVDLPELKEKSIEK